MRFNEATLESAIIELLQAELYIYVDGKTLHKEMRDVLLRDDLHGYLRTKYAKDGITESEIASIILLLDTVSTASLYDANKAVLGKFAMALYSLVRTETKKISLLNSSTLKHLQTT